VAAAVNKNNQTQQKKEQREGDERDHQRASVSGFLFAAGHAAASATL